MSRRATCGLDKWQALPLAERLGENRTRLTGTLLSFSVSLTFRVKVTVRVRVKVIVKTMLS